MKEGELGSHPCQKGAITHVSAGCTVSPPMAAICLKVSWSMGPVKDQYIHHEKAGGQFVGKCATGISSLGKEFAMLPVYWDFTNGPVGIRNTIDETIGDNFATMNEVEGKSFDLLQFLFASFIIIFLILTFTVSINYALLLCSLQHQMQQFRNVQW